ncbi:MAG: qbdA [Bradyrhizobium sp.]|nr:qbdA [Bradyrhizobium sp.]
MTLFRTLRAGTLAAICTLSLAACQKVPENRGSGDAGTPGKADQVRLADGAGGNDWAAYGRTYGEQHFSPLTQVNADNVGQLGLAWSIDLGPGNPATIPLAINGVLYFANGLSVVHAVDATTGKEKWVYDPDVPSAAGQKLRQGWGSRGIGYWNGKIYVGTGDGRLIAVDVNSGKPVWSVLTVGRDDGRYITGAPRLFDGKVIIGHGGSDSANTRGYVTTYDAETGKQLWRFYIVPGNPADGFEDEAQKMAARTWHGEWWKHGGGGAAWNGFTYDAGTDTIFVGTGNGSPWNQKIRSEGRGDNLFLCSVVALDAKTGAYKWHYQINPGETWDYNAAMDMQLADLTIAGKPRKVLMTAPKNGFFYVLDRITGKLISAEKIAKVTWASKINLTTGRPVENPVARFPNGSSFELWPSPTGAHSWMPMAFSPNTGLVYIPKIESGANYSDRGIDIQHWKRTPGNAYDFGEIPDLNVKNPLQDTSWLMAWDPVRQKRIWQIRTAGRYNGGVMATAGGLVFQGQEDGRFAAYAAATGKRLWSFDAQAGIIAAPISYSVRGVQYVTVLVGMGTSPSITMGTQKLGTDFDDRTQAKRVLTFALGGKAALPRHQPVVERLEPDPDFRQDPSLATAGMIVFGQRCAVCHGLNAIAGGTAPDLRRSQVPLSSDAFDSVLRDGALVAAGMPRFEEMSDADRRAVRQYVRTRRFEIGK